MDTYREYVLAGLFVALAISAGIVLRAVLQTVVFAITVAYVLYPFKHWLTRRRFSDRIASALTTLLVFVVVVIIFAPLVGMLYQRRSQFIEFLQAAPESISLSFGTLSGSISTEPIISGAITTLRDVAVDLAVAVPGLTLQLGLFVLLLYGLLLKPGSIRTAVLSAVPESYHDILFRFHGRTRRTLFSLYVLQVATAFGTFVIALVLFWALGYSAVLSLGVIAGILQFIPILGPSILVVALAGNDLVVGNPTRAAAMLVLGLVLIAFLPDAVIRTKLSGTTGEIAPSLYFIGFVGGVLTVGPIGIIVGPLVVSLLTESVTLLAENNGDSTTA
ncbi:AI-2E family transporter [Halovenus halobia]|uniref:AI-2E family transporter n=1 Tax=Halovenus halobia TaxID=3396622 RepID=UPI003F5537F9